MGPSSAAPAVRYPLRPSGHKKWGHCPGSVRLEADEPGSTSAAAEEGTNAHHLGFVSLRDGRDPLSYVGLILARPCDDTSTVVTFRVSREMADAVKVYTDEVLYWYNELPGAQLLLEHRVHMGFILPGMSGSADAVVVQPFGKLVCIDYKHGIGVSVDNPEENGQVWAYTMSAAKHFNCPTMMGIIIQPRDRNKDKPAIRRHEWTKDQARAHLLTLRDQAQATQHPDAALKPGAWCRQGFCDARYRCPALRGRAMTMVKISEQNWRGETAWAPPPIPDDVQQLGFVIRNADMVRDWLKEVEAAGLRSAVRGKMPSGCKPVHTQTKTTWRKDKDGDKLIAALSRTAGKTLRPADFRKPAQPISIGDARKLLLAAGVDKDKVRQFLGRWTRKSEPATILVDTDDKRDAVELTIRDGVSIFKDYLPKPTMPDWMK